MSYVEWLNIGMSNVVCFAEIRHTCTTTQRDGVGGVRGSGGECKITFDGFSYSVDKTIISAIDILNVKQE